ncbi:MAG: hypothetical protein LM555_02710 [Desulfurococcaceae archaeon]|nr:hypothetical protein [Desulfurococcaceae archaeon]
MAVEYPVLAILASIFFIAIVFSSLYLYLYIVSEVNRIPIVGGYAVVEKTSSGWRVNVTVRHERGEVVVLQRLVLVTEEGTITIDSFPYSSGGVVVNLRGGFSNRALLPGSTGQVVVELPQYYLVSNKTYTGWVEFDKGTLLFSFTTP